MARQLTTDQIKQIWELKHLPQRTISARVGVSLSSVSKTLGQPPPGTAGDTDPRSVAECASRLDLPAGPEPDAVAVAEQLVAGGGTNEEELRASLARLQKAGRLAEADKDVARVVLVERVSMQVLALLEKMKPEPVVDVNTHPDMVAAADRFRKTAREKLERILSGAK